MSIRGTLRRLERREARGFKTPTKTKLRWGINRDKNTIILSLPIELKHLCLTIEEADLMIENLKKCKERLSM